MKTTSILLVVLLALGIDSTASSVPPKYTFKVNAGNFGRVQAHRQQQGATLTWQVLNANSVAGFIVERSYDGEFFEEVGDATVETSGRGKFHENFVYPGFIHYRIVAINHDGSSEVSETIILHKVSKK